MNYFITQTNRLGKEYATTNDSNYINLIFESSGNIHTDPPCGIFKKDCLIKVINYDKDTFINVDSGLLYDKETLKIVGQHNA